MVYAFVALMRSDQNSVAIESARVRSLVQSFDAEARSSNKDTGKAVTLNFLVEMKVERVGLGSVASLMPAKRRTGKHHINLMRLKRAFEVPSVNHLPVC